jgi:hypothetical protein
MLRAVGQAELEKVLDSPKKRKKGDRAPVYVGGSRTDVWRKEKKEQERAQSMQGMPKLMSYFKPVCDHG